MPRFITIAQQPGAEAAELPRRIADALNAQQPGEIPWLTWDEELIDKVSADSHLPSDVIQSFETSGHSWLDDLLAGILGRTDEAPVFAHVRDTVRTLAQAGRAIIAGQSAVHLTGDLPGGLHIRLVAPQTKRIENISRRFDLTRARARKHIAELDRRRTAVLQRFFPDQPPAAERVAAELNTARLNERQLVAAILAMLPVRG